MNGNKVKNRVGVLVILVLGIILVYIILSKKTFIYQSIDKVEDTVSELNIVVVGDVMLDRNVRNIINTSGFDSFFTGVSSLIGDADIAVANLEGPFTSYPSRTASLQSKELVFTFDTTLAPKLASLGFDVIGLANNHTLNFGYEGLEMTRRYIGSSGMMYYGDPANKDEISTVLSQQGIVVGIVGFHEFNYTNFDNVFSEITRLRPLVDVLIVTPHWGVEYQAEPTVKMTEWAHAFIDRGADVVIGTHPHVVGVKEVYGGKHIYYSLGNFVFDQYFSKATMHGLAVRMTVTKKDGHISLQYKDIPTVVDKNGVRVE